MVIDVPPSAGLLLLDVVDAADQGTPRSVWQRQIEIFVRRRKLPACQRFSTA
jgi:hypothetical protein